MFLKKRKASSDDITSIKTLQKKCIEELKKSKLNGYVRDLLVYESLKNCYQYIESFYFFSNKYTEGELFDRLSHIEYLTNLKLNAINSIILGILTWGITSLLDQFAVKSIEIILKDSSLGQFPILIKLIVFLLLILIVIVSALISWGLIIYGATWVKKFSDDKYKLFVLPYEKEVILQVLESKYDLSLKPQKGSKMLK